MTLYLVINSATEEVLHTYTVAWAANNRKEELDAELDDSCYIVAIHLGSNRD